MRLLLLVISVSFFCTLLHSSNLDSYPFLVEDIPIKCEDLNVLIGLPDVVSEASQLILHPVEDSDTESFFQNQMHSDSLSSDSNLSESPVPNLNSFAFSSLSSGSDSEGEVELPKKRTKSEQATSQKRHATSSLGIRNMLQEKFELKYPNEIFRRHTCLILNWPEEVDQHKRTWSKVEIEKILSALDSLDFIIKDEEHDETAGLRRIQRAGKSLAFKESEEANQKRPKPAKTTKPQKSKTKSNLPRHRPIRKYFTQNIEIRKELKEAFLKKHPQRTFRMSRCQIVNWPEDVDRLKQDWSLEEIERIRCGMDSLDFIFLEKQISYLKSRNIALNKVDGGSLREISRNEAHAEILERFRLESGFTEAATLDWKQVDVSAIPEKFGINTMNARLFALRRVYGNSEILDNIHFARYADKVLEGKLNDYAGYRALLAKYREQIDLAAKIILWNKVHVEGLEGIYIDACRKPVDRKFLERIKDVQFSRLAETAVNEES